MRDIYTVETLQMPARTLESRYGDCDDKAMLLAALLASIGHQVRFIAVAFQPGQFVHVWLQDWVGGAWLDLEPTEPIPCGQRVPDQAGAEYLTCELGQ